MPEHLWILSAASEEVRHERRLRGITERVSLNVEALIELRSLVRHGHVANEAKLFFHGGAE